MAGLKSITQTSPVQTDALNILKAIKLQRPAILKKHGAAKLNKIVQGLEAITRLKPADIKKAQSKNANLKLITIKAQEILQGDVMLGAVQLSTVMPKVRKVSKVQNISTQNYQALLTDSKAGMDYYAAYMKKYPNDLWYKNQFAEMQKKYNSVREAFSKQNANLIYIPKVILPDKNHVPYKSKLPVTKNTSGSQTETFMESVTAYLPYIVMGGVLLLVLFSQTSGGKK